MDTQDTRRLLAFFVMLLMTLILKITAKNGCLGCPQLSGSALLLFSVPLVRWRGGGITVPST